MARRSGQHTAFSLSSFRLVPFAISCLCFVLSFHFSLIAQDERKVRVNGNLVQVRILGLPDATAARSIVVFESGVGTGLSAWASVLPEVARFATVVAYDRAGIGGSDTDGSAYSAARR